MKLQMLNTTYEVENSEEAEHLIQDYCDEHGFNYKRGLMPGDYIIIEINVDDEGTPFEFIIDVAAIIDD